MAVPAGDESIEISVLALSGELLLVLSLAANGTVLDLKRQIASHCGHVVELQHLSYENQVLADDSHDRTLTDLGLDGTVVTLILKHLDVDKHLETLRAGGLATEDDIRILCACAKDIFLKEPSLLELQPPVVIAGHVMGCAKQLNYIFDTFGGPEMSQYLFLGNYVSRGKQSLECMILLLLYKKKHPERMHLLRGQHESASVSRIYGFYDECKRRFNIKIWKTFIDVFNSLPLCALVKDRIFCVPSGLSPFLCTFDDVRTIKRPDDVPDSGLLCDLLWSYFDSDIVGWQASNHAVEMIYGPDVLDKFLQDNQLETWWYWYNSVLYSIFFYCTVICFLICFLHFVN